jgi:hypothetical protein
MRATFIGERQTMPLFSRLGLLLNVALFALPSQRSAKSLLHPRGRAGHQQRSPGATRQSDGKHDLDTFLANYRPEDIM